MLHTHAKGTREAEKWIEEQMKMLKDDLRMRESIIMVEFMERHGAGRSGEAMSGISMKAINEVKAIAMSAGMSAREALERVGEASDRYTRKQFCNITRMTNSEDQINTTKWNIEDEMREVMTSTTKAEDEWMDEMMVMELPA